METKGSSCKCERLSSKKEKKRAASLVGDSLEDVTVELFLPVSKELANHLPTQAFPLEQEVGHTHRSVRNKVSFYQILNALLWFSADREEEERGRGGGRGREGGGLEREGEMERWRHPEGKKTNR